MQISRRRLIGNGTGHRTVPVMNNDPSVNRASKDKVEYANAQWASMTDALVEKKAKAAAEAAAKAKKIEGKTELAEGTLETAADGNFTSMNMNISDIATRTYLTPLLEEIIPEQSDLHTPPVTMYRLYRDIYYYDSISGGSIDMMASLAFSDFNLVGLDEKQLRPFMQSVENMRVRRLLPQLSTEYLVHGLYIAQMAWNDSKKIFDSVIPHNPSFSHVAPNPVFGRDPQVTIDFQNALIELSGSANRNGSMSAGKRGNSNVAPQLQDIPEKYRNQTSFTIPIDELIYMTRKGMMRDIRGVSYLRRVLPIWLLEKAIIRGTLDQATKRQRGIAHIIAGEEDWVPTVDDMRMLSEMYMAADLDPTGAVFITRNGVQVSEISAADAFWKWPDVYDFASQAKMRALSINEAILSGDATIATMDTAMSSLVEQVREHRDTIAYEVFYERMFPRIAVENNVKLKGKQKGAFGHQLESAGLSVFEYASVVENYDATKHAIPRVQWHKRLRPEADSAYLEVLTTLEDKGLPIPLQLWAASGGMDMDSLINGMETDAKYRKQVAEWRKQVGPQEGEEGGEEEEAAVINAVLDQAAIARVGVLERPYQDTADDNGILNIAGGKRKLLTAKGRKVLSERIHKAVAEAAVNIAERENAKLKRDQQ